MNPLFSNIINKAKAVAHSQGKQATKVLRTQLFGTRPEIVSSASDALAHTPAIGVALGSVFSNGPKKTKLGAPALKRQRSA